MTKEKSTVPRLRFPGFTDAWKQRKFSDLAEVRRGLTYSPSAIRSHGVRVLRSSNINEDTFVFGEDDVFVDKSVVKIPLVEEGDILITSANGSSRLVGKHSIIKGLPSNSAIHGGFMLLASSKVPCFLNAFMSSTWYHKFIGLYVAGGNGAIGNLNKSDLDEQIVLVPTLPEQEAIGSFFSDLDQLITLHQRKLDDVKELKKALLQKMFPKGNGNDFPELRFPEFTDAWKQRKLGEVADFSIKTNSLSRDKLSSYFYEVQNIHYGDILTKYDAILDVCNKELPSIIGSTISDFADDLLIEGDIVFADAAEDSTVGKAVEVRNFKGKNVVSGLHTIVARPKVSYAPYYLGYLINSTAYHNQILPLMQGTKVSSISKANLKSTTVVFPTLPEQEAIGNFFSDLDQLITLHQRQLDHLKLLKKALLQQMFI
ncbi:TPA: restriction endonuclease subunit S [Streptococcus suis]|uniref:restriction endonuclease subunit S n=1 Tax=Streptococcus suis TaxID=1307 RepID=UPI0015527B7C|nr:restriction endonuclease subunit S [Streptococcus suis]NQM23833.1 restriction endonuclease subunit S [Streptococcus suis]HEM4273640.1 restriction endonuclease subunit S [Streptococcus suis]HEM5194318.1 restriction endonuclease subunit S [Streptococcus suis]HEM5218440.1 restriction endonuclease subunit S [Streptococcus suis]